MAAKIFYHHAVRFARRSVNNMSTHTPINTTSESTCAAKALPPLANRILTSTAYSRKYSAILLLVYPFLTGDLHWTPKGFQLARVFRIFRILCNCSAILDHLTTLANQIRVTFIMMYQQILGQHIMDKVDDLIPSLKHYLFSYLYSS
jgi:hypothetical protein